MTVKYYLVNIKHDIFVKWQCYLCGSKSTEENKVTDRKFHSGFVKWLHNKILGTYMHFKQCDTSNTPFWFLCTFPPYNFFLNNMKIQCQIFLKLKSETVLNIQKLQHLTHPHKHMCTWIQKTQKPLRRFHFTSNESLGV